MPRENVELRITARDRATRAIEQIEGRLEGLDEAARFDIELGNLSELRSDLDRIEEQARGIRADVDTTQAERSIRELSGQLEQGMQAEVDLDITRALRQVSRLETALERAVRQRAVITGLAGVAQDAPELQPVAFAPTPQPPLGRLGAPPTLSVAARFAQQPTRFPAGLLPQPTTAAGGRLARRAQRRLPQPEPLQPPGQQLSFLESLAGVAGLETGTIEALAQGSPALQQQPLTQFIRGLRQLDVSDPLGQPLAQAGVIPDVEGFTEEDLLEAELVGAEPFFTTVGAVAGVSSLRALIQRGLQSRPVSRFLTGNEFLRRAALEAPEVGGGLRGAFGRYVGGIGRRTVSEGGRRGTVGGVRRARFQSLRDRVQQATPFGRDVRPGAQGRPFEFPEELQVGARPQLGRSITRGGRPRSSPEDLRRFNEELRTFYEGRRAFRQEQLGQRTLFSDFSRANIRRQFNIGRARIGRTPVAGSILRGAEATGRFAQTRPGQLVGSGAAAIGGGLLTAQAFQDDEDQASLGAADIETQQREFDAVVQRLGISPGIANIIVDEIDNELNAGRATALRYATIALQSQEPALIAQATEVFEFLQARIRIQGIEEQGPDAIIDRFTQAVFEEGGLANLSNLGIPESLVAPEVIEAQARADLGLREGEEIPRTQEGFRAVLSAQARTLAQLATTPQARQSVAAARPGLRTATEALRDDFRRLTSESIFEALNNAFGRQPLPAAPAREVTPGDIGLAGGQRLLEQEALAQRGEQAIARAETAAEEFPQVGAFLPGQQQRFDAIRDRFEGPFRELTNQQIEELFTFAPQLRADVLGVIEEELEAAQGEAAGGRPFAGGGRGGRGRGTFLSAANRVLSFEDFQRQIPFLPSGFAGTLAPATGDEFRQQLDALGADLVDPRRQGLAPSGFAAALPGIRGPQFREQLRNLGRGTTQEAPQGFGGAFAGALGGQLSGGLFGFESLAALATPTGVGAFLGGAIGDQLVDIGLDQLDELRARITPTLQGIFLNTSAEDTSAELDLVPGLSPSSPALPQEQNPFTPGPEGTGQQYLDDIARLAAAIEALQAGTLTVNVQAEINTLDAEGSAEAVAELAEMTADRIAQQMRDRVFTVPADAVEDA